MQSRKSDYGGIDFSAKGTLIRGLVLALKDAGRLANAVGGLRFVWWLRQRRVQGRLRGRDRNELLIELRWE